MRPRRDRWGGGGAGNVDVPGSILDDTETAMPLHYQSTVNGVLDETWSK
jgi:hypothetical protein